MERDRIGLIMPDGTEVSAHSIKRKLLAQDLQDSSRVISRGQEPAPRGFGEWVEVARRQQQDRRELLGIPEHVEVEIETSRPIFIGLIGDVHTGGTDVDYDRFGRDIELIKEYGGYAITVGDLTDSFFFMPEVGEQLFSGDEQVLFMESALSELSDGDHLLASWAGDHDMWSKDKSGAHTLYHKFRQQYNAHYLEGLSYLTVGLNDGATVVPYRFVGSHRHKGYSWFHSSHSGIRQEMEGRGADVSFTAHMHEKSHLRKLVKDFGGEEHTIDCVALGTYKESDRYSRKFGWSRKDPKEMGAFGIVITPGEKNVEVYWTLEEAIDHLN